LALPIICHSVLRFPVVDSSVPVGVVVGSPTKYAITVKVAGVGEVDKPKRLFGPRAPVVEDRGSPRYGLSLDAVPLHEQELPVLPRQIAEEVETLLAIHAHGSSVVRLGCIETGKIQNSGAAV